MLTCRFLCLSVQSLNVIGIGSDSTVSINGAYTTDDELSSALCPLPDGTTTVQISITSGSYLKIPTCLKSSGDTTVTSVQLSGIVFAFSSIPSAVKNLTVYGSQLDSSASGTGTGLVTNTITPNWSELSTLFPSLAYVHLEALYFTGALPDMLPSKWLTTILDYNHLTGTIPSNLFSNLSLSTGNSFQFSIEGNWLSGALTTALFAPLSGKLLSSFNFNANYISLTTIPDGLFPGDLLGGSATFQFEAQSCGLTGTLPPTLLHGLSSLTFFRFDTSYNQLSGSLPSSLFSSWSWSGSYDFYYAVNNNSLSGSIPAGLLTTGLAASTTMSNIALELDANRLSGTLPSLFTSSDGTVTISVTYFIYLRFNNNSLSGPLPSGLLSSMTMATDTSLSLDVSDNPLNTEFPSDLLKPLPGYRAFVTANNAKLYGSPPAECWANANTWVTYSFAGNALNGTIPSAWASCVFTSIDLSSNPSLHGTIPSSLLQISALTTFSASSTSLTGTLPTVASTLTSLSLLNTQLSFCDESSLSSLDEFVGTCSVSGGGVCACAKSYDAVCTVVCAPCSNSTRPSTDFTCVYGVWTASSTNATTIVIPSGAGTVVVTGNLTSTGVVIQGLGSSINVTGTVANLTHITIELSQSQAESIGSSSVLQVLLNTGNSSDLSSVTVSSKVTSGCKKVKAEKTVTNGGATLGAYLTLDKSGCNTWWIIVVAVVAGVVVIGVSIIILLAIFNKSCREKMRPYSSRRQRASQKSVA